MKKLGYIYALLIAALFGWAISSCDDSGIITFDEEERAVLAYDNGETVKTTFTIGLSAPDVSADADLDAQTRALDNANIDFFHLIRDGSIMFLTNVTKSINLIVLFIVNVFLRHINI